MEKTLGSLFDGIGGFPLAGVYSGFTSLWASEIEPFPIRVTKERFPQMKHLGDITKIKGAEIEPTAVICGGSPCQDLSVAGLRAGMAQKCSQCGKEFDISDEISNCPVCGSEIEKTRSGLFMEQIRIVKEMREADAKRGRTGQSIRPRFMVWENVPGAFSSHSGEDFRIVLEEICRIAYSPVHIPRPSEGWPTVGAIMGNGFSVAWRVLDAQYWGVPQRRRRIFIVADFAGFSATKILFKRESVSGNPSESGAQGQRIAADAKRSVGTSGRCSVIPINDQATHEKGCSNGSMVGKENDPMYSLTATDRHAIAVSAGFKGKAGAKAGSIGFEKELAPTLQAEQPSHVVCYDARGNGDGATAATLTGDHQRRISDYTSLAVLLHNPAPPLDASYYKGSGERNGIEREIVATYQKVTGTLSPGAHPGGYNGQDASNDMLVVSRNFEMYENSRHSEYKKGCGTLKGSGGDTGGGGENLVCLSEAHARKKYAFAVRRLTPLECERLQGYPDGWTDIPGASDSARYKALGNSVAVPCVAYIMRGMACEMEKAARKKKERENNESD